MSQSFSWATLRQKGRSKLHRPVLMKSRLFMRRQCHPTKVVSLQDLKVAIVRPKLLRISFTRDTQRIKNITRLVEKYSESVADKSVRN
jgi:hypothetical protein